MRGVSALAELIVDADVRNFLQVSCLLLIHFAKSSTHEY